MQYIIYVGRCSACVPQLAGSQPNRQHQTPEPVDLMASLQPFSLESKIQNCSFRSKKNKQNHFHRASNARSIQDGKPCWITSGLGYVDRRDGHSSNARYARPYVFFFAQDMACHSAMGAAPRGLHMWRKRLESQGRFYYSTYNFRFNMVELFP